MSPLFDRRTALLGPVENSVPLGAEESLRGEAVSHRFLLPKENPFTRVSDSRNLGFPTPGINLLKEGFLLGSDLNHPNTL